MTSKLPTKHENLLRQWQVKGERIKCRLFWNSVRAKAVSTEKAKVWLKEHDQILEEEV